MPVLTILTGLPGSGKSFHLEKYHPKHWSDFTLPKYRYGKGGLPEVVAELMSGRN
ncbi:MAG: hypothetical protein HUJ26_04760 [Planctomycetaceae bacterium]|nr:hypothetical protein [Planctomycetaceae bacterium]